jgi:hypothetical protein
MGKRPPVRSEELIGHPIKRRIIILTSTRESPAIHISPVQAIALRDVIRAGPRGKGKSPLLREYKQSTIDQLVLLGLITEVEMRRRAGVPLASYVVTSLGITVASDHIR